MVPLRIDDCPNSWTWETPRRKPMLTLEDVSSPKPVPAKKTIRRHNAGKLENILFAMTFLAVALFFLVSFVMSALPIASDILHRDQFAGNPIVTVTVGQGDNLWRYANRYGASDIYILDRIESIAQFNHLSSNAPLIPGQHLRIPVSNPVLVAQLEKQNHKQVAMLPSW